MLGVAAVAMFMDSLTKASIETKTDRKHDLLPDGTRVVIVDRKACPPHKWRWVEIKDHEGETHGWKIECELCGPLKPIGG
jgi:hypothetical protein